MTGGDRIVNKRTRAALPMLLIVLAALVLTAVLSGCAASDGGGSAQAPEGEAQGSPDRAEGGGQPSQDSGTLGHPAIGRADAPVVLIEYGDYG